MSARRLKLFTISGFEVGLDFSWIVIAILVAWSLSTGLFPFYYKNLSSQTYWVMGILGAAGLFISIIVHEFSHSIVARKKGVPMKGITLFIFGGVAEMGNEPSNARDEFNIAVAGPISSVVLAIAFYLLFRFGIRLEWHPAINGVIGYLSTINLILAIFNLVPAYPLDGGRILRSFLWQWKKNLRWATKIASDIGSGFGIFLIILGVIRIVSGNFIGGLWFGLIGLFIQGAARMSYQQLVTRKALEGESIERFMNKDPVTVRPSITIRELVEDYIYPHYYKFFPVVDNNGRLMGCITTNQIKTIEQDEWSQHTVGEAATGCSNENTITPDADPVEALSAMRQNNISRLMVVKDDQLVGIITLKDMLEFLNLKIELEL